MMKISLAHGYSMRDHHLMLRFTISITIYSIQLLPVRFISDSYKALIPSFLLVNVFVDDYVVVIVVVDVVVIVAASTASVIVCGYQFMWSIFRKIQCLSHMCRNLFHFQKKKNTQSVHVLQMLSYVA